LFWTVPIPRDNVVVFPGAESALMHVSNLSLRDDFTFENSVLHKGPPPVRATASFVMKWFDVKRRFKVRDRKNDFAGRFAETDASIFWSAKEEGFTFVSDPPEKSNAVFAILGRERNGVFFP